MKPACMLTEEERPVIPFHALTEKFFPVIVEYLPKNVFMMAAEGFIET